jgi:hypothetical protein
MILFVGCSSHSKLSIHSTSTQFLFDSHLIHWTQPHLPSMNCPFTVCSLSALFHRSPLLLKSARPLLMTIQITLIDVENTSSRRLPLLVHPSFFVLYLTSIHHCLCLSSYHTLLPTSSLNLATTLHRLGIFSLAEPPWAV